MVVTRPAAQARPWVERLRALGIDALALPLIEILPADDVAALQRAWLELPRAALAMFVSANAVEHFFAARPAGAAWPPGTLAGSTGPGTSAALRGCGVPAAQLVEPASDAPAFDSEALWARLAAQPWKGCRVLVVRGEEGRDWFADTLRQAGADVGFVSAYRRAVPVLDDAGRALVAAALAQPDAHLWHFSSSEAARNLAGRLSATEAGRLRDARALATHPRIAESLRQLGFGRVALVAPGPEAVAAEVRSIQSRTS